MIAMQNLLIGTHTYRTGTKSAMDSRIRELIVSDTQVRIMHNA